MGMKSSAGEGEIVQVQGGHIIRATGRKDRHSKVYTAKGPRDRRVRLSAHTAIQFYDVQDRLGYDRPSKAVDWLIKKAKSAIDKLAEVPQPFEPNAGLNADTVVSHRQDQKPESSEYDFQINSGGGGDVGTNQQTHFSSSLVAPLANLDPDAMKSFFPTSTSNASINFQSYPHDMISRTVNPSEDLGLSLHPFQGNAGQASSTDQTLFTGSAALSFDANFPRLSGWNSELATPENRSFMVNSHQPSPSLALLNQQAMLLGHHGPSPSSLLLSHHQRGTLQSSFSQPFRSWGDHLSVDLQEKTHDHHMEHHHHHHQASVFGSQFGSHGIMQGFSIPTRIHGGEGEGIGADRPSSSSSSPPNSNH